MTNNTDKAITALKERFNAQTSDICVDANLIIAGDHIVEAARILRDEYGFNMLADITASDYWPETSPRFHLIYIFSLAPVNSTTEKNLRLILRVPVNEDNPEVHTVEGVYPGANWFEREIWDMFGIRFEGHSDPRRLIMPRDWNGHPLRKDYPLGYEEPQFTFNYDDIARRKVTGKKEEE